MDGYLAEEADMAREWHERGVAPEAVLGVSLGAMLLIGFVTQVVREVSGV